MTKDHDDKYLIDQEELDRLDLINELGIRVWPIDLEDEEEYKDEV